MAPKQQTIISYSPKRQLALTVFDSALEAELAAGNGEDVQLRGTWCRAELSATEDEFRFELENGQCIVAWLSSNDAPRLEFTAEKVFAPEAGSSASTLRMPHLTTREDGPASRSAKEASTSRRSSPHSRHWGMKERTTWS